MGTLVAICETFWKKMFFFGKFLADNNRAMQEFYRLIIHRDCKPEGRLELGYKNGKNKIRGV